MEWANVWAIVVLLLIPLFLGIWFASDRLKLLTISKIADISVLFNSTLRFSKNTKIYKRLMLVLAIFFLTIALMQPHKQIGVQKLRIKSLDMVIALDTSLSMLAEDLKPNRLMRAKMEISQLVDKLHGDRVGLVVFAGQALVQCPLTTDYYAFKRFLEAVDVNTVPLPGTNIASAISVSLKALSEDKDSYKVILLITDGEAFDKQKTIEMVQKARESGVKIYCIGIGTKEGEPIPLPTGGYKKDKEGKVVLTRLDEDLLLKIATITYGAYMRAGTGSLDVDKMYRLIAKEKRRIARQEIVPIYAEYFVYPLSLALIMFLLAWFLPFDKKQWKQWLDSLNKFSMLVLVFFVIGWRWDYLSNNKAVSVYKKGDKQKAETILEKLKKKRSEDPIINYNLGNIYYEKGEDPVANYQIATLSDNPELRKYAFYNLGDYYFKKNQFKKAIDSYQQALLIDPNFINARYNLELALKKVKALNQKKNASNNAANRKNKKFQKGQNQNQKRQKKGKNKKSNQKQNNKGQREQEQNLSGNNSNSQQQGHSNYQQRNQQGNKQNREQNKGAMNERKSRSFGPQSSKGNSQREQQSSATQNQNQVYNNKKESDQQIWAVLQAVSDEELTAKDVNKKRIKIRTFNNIDKDW